MSLLHFCGSTFFSHNKEAAGKQGASDISNP